MGSDAGSGIVGRAAELQATRALLHRVLGGRGGVLVVGGEAGIGKSRLVAALEEEAQAAGALVAAGSCVRMDVGAIPYAAIIGALRGVLRGVEPGALAGSLGPYRRDVARLLPEVARLGVPVQSGSAAVPGMAAAAPVVQPGTGASAPVAAPDAADPLARLRLFEALTGWLARLAEGRPLVLVVEDLHWADPATLDLVRAIALAAGSSRLLLAVTLRTDEPPSGTIRETVAELVRDGAERLELAPLDRRALAELARDAGLAIDGEALDRLFDQTGGNPFLALELVEAGAVVGSGSPPYRDLPPTLRDIVDARLAALDEPTREALRAAALHPGPIDDWVLATVLDRPVAAVGRSLREALAAGVLVADHPTGGAPRFRQALQRDVLVGQLGAGERRLLHARFADALAAGAGGTPVDPALASAIASHRDAAGDDGAALDAHLVALDAAERAFAFEAAAHHARRAATLVGRSSLPPVPPTPDAAALLERASLAALLAGDPAASAALAREAVPLVAGDPDRLATMSDRVRWALWEAGDREGARAELEAAAATLADAPPGPATALLLAQLAAMRMTDADPAVALELTDRALAMARAAGSLDAEALALGVRGRTLAMHGDVDGGVASLREGVAIADRQGALQGLVVGQAAIVEVLARSGRAREALAEADRALETADRLGLARSLGSSLMAEAARSCFALGDWSEAARRVRDGLERRPPAIAEARLRIVALRLAAARGEAEAAATHDRRLAALEPVLAEDDERAALDVGRAELALAEGRPMAVRALVERATAAVGAGAEVGSSTAWLAALAVRAEVDLAISARAAGDDAARSEAVARARAIEALAGRAAPSATTAWGPRAAAILAQLGAELTRLGTDPAGRAAAWAAAVAAWAAIDRPYHAAYARWRLAEARLAAGEARPAVAAPLREAAHALRRLGAAPLLAEVDRLARLARVDLGAAGEPGEAAATSTPDDPLATLELTIREREVLRLVAAGCSNATVAHELGIAVKTASVHVSNILAKLGVANRVEAAALAHRLGVVGPGAGARPARGDPPG